MRAVLTHQRICESSRRIHEITENGRKDNQQVGININIKRINTDHPSFLALPDNCPYNQVDSRRERIAAW
jgi:hypothetical protein